MTTHNSRSFKEKKDIYFTSRNQDFRKIQHSRVQAGVQCLNHLKMKVMLTVPLGYLIILVVWKALQSLPFILLQYVPPYDLNNRDNMLVCQTVGTNSPELLYQSRQCVRSFEWEFTPSAAGNSIQRNGYQHPYNIYHYVH